MGGLKPRIPLMQKQKRKVFTSKAIKAVKKKRRADLAEYRKSLNESNYLGIFTSVAGYARRQTFYMPTRRRVWEAGVSESKDFACCFVDATTPMRRENEKTNADESDTIDGWSCMLVLNDNTCVTSECYLDSISNALTLRAALRKIAQAQRQFIEPAYKRRKEKDVFEYFWSTNGMDGHFLILAVGNPLKSSNGSCWRVLTRHGQLFEINFCQLEYLRRLLDKNDDSKEWYARVCADEKEMLRYHTSRTDFLRERTLSNFAACRRGESVMEFYIIGLACGSCQDTVHAAEVLVHRYPQMFGPKGTCSLKCILMDERFTFRGAPNQKLFWRSNTLVYSGNVDTISVVSVPLHSETKVLERMRNLERYVGKGHIFNFHRCDYGNGQYAFAFYHLRDRCLLFTSGINCSAHSPLNTTPSVPHDEGLANACDDALVVFSFIAASCPLMWIFENSGSNTSTRETENRRLSVQPCMQALIDYRSEFTHCMLCDDCCDGLLTPPGRFDSNKSAMIMKRTDCFSNVYKVTSGCCSEKILLSDGRMKSYMCLGKRITNKHKELPRSSPARAAWPSGFFEGFVSSLCYLLDGLSFQALRAWQDEDAFAIRERKRELLEAEEE